MSDRKKPLISVVTPSWNQGCYIADCVESVMGLDDGLVEHIVIDNCSDDETHEVLERYPHLDVVVEKDRGQSDALNKGFARATGDWILWLNADDFLLPGILQTYVDIVAEKPDLDLLYGYMVFVGPDKEWIRTIYQVRWHYSMIQFGLLCMPSTGSLFRASLLKENPLDLDCHIIMDSEWALRNGKGLRVRRLRRDAVAFRVTDDNKTSHNIRTGELTPRHAEERKRVAKMHPFYGKAGENSFGPLGNLLLKAARKLVRVRILADKGFNRLIKPSRYGKSEQATSNQN